jgi:hypothetical protein
MARVLDTLLFAAAALSVAASGYWLAVERGAYLAGHVIIP